MQHYAVWYPYGTRTLNTWGNDAPNGGGCRADRLCAYPSRAARDAAVRKDPEHMEAIKATNPALRRYVAMCRRRGYPLTD